DHIAPYDPAKDVDEDGFDVLIREQDLECLFDTLLRSSAADIKEVRGFAAGEFNDIHGRHREARAVDHTADVAVELDVVEIEVRSFDLELLLCVHVAKLSEILVPEHHVVVEIQLSVQSDQSSLYGQAEGVNHKNRSVRAL